MKVIKLEKMSDRRGWDSELLPKSWVTLKGTIDFLEDTGVKHPL